MCFKLNEAMLTGDVARLVRLDGLKGEGEAPPLVLWAMAEELRTLLKLKSGVAQGRPLGALLKEYRIWGPREKLMEPAFKACQFADTTSSATRCCTDRQNGKGLRAPKFRRRCMGCFVAVGIASR